GVAEALEDEIWGIISHAEILRQPWTQKIYLEEEELTVPGPDPTTRVVTEQMEVDGKRYEVKHDADGSFYLIEHPGEDIGNMVLLHGENGTGKTLAAAATAQYCLENGWSFIQARWDEDLRHVLRFPELLGTPCVVVIEDMEKLISNDPAKMDLLLEQFDGMRTKGREVLLLMTSNHVGELPKALTRAGRINR